MTNDFYTVMKERGFVYQSTDDTEIAILSRAKGLKLYVGFDATADGLHVGSLIQLMMLRWAGKTETPAIALLGGFTTLVGDPTGRKDARKPLSHDQIATNYNAIKLEIDDIVNDRNGDACEFINNAQWLGDLSFADFLTLYAPHFSVNRMMAMDSVKTRFEAENGLSMMEFTYSMLQAIDFLELNNVERCNLQVGGSDQWSNIISGVDLIRRKTGSAAYGITTPLMTNAAGEKMGKTAGGAVWLDPQKTSPLDFWQFWRNVDDVKVGQFLGLFTDLPMEEVARLRALGGSEINEAKKILATEATRIVHGVEAANNARDAADAAFARGDLSQLPLTVLDGAIFDAPLSHLVSQVRECSRSEARRLIDGNAVKINGRVVQDDDVLYSILPVVDGPFSLDVGKKNKYRIATT